MPKILRSILILWVPVIILVVWTVTPLLWTLSGSFKTRVGVYDASLLPDPPTLYGYQRALGLNNFEVYLFNSLFISIAATVIVILVSCLIAYATARYAFRFRHALLLLILLVRLVPRVTLIVPLYQMIHAAGMLNTYTALIITTAASTVPLAAWILVGFFRGVPREIEEAAAVDGASGWQRFRRVALPLAIPGLVTVAMLAFRDAWNEFPFVLAFTTDASRRTMPYALFLLDESLGVEDWPTIHAFSLLSIIPIVLLYLIIERQVVSGLTSGAVK